MITLAEKLAALNIEIGIQGLSNDVAILRALGEISKALYLPDTLARIADEIGRNVEFRDVVVKKLNELTPGESDGN